jgi:hypothetical protein
LFFIIYKRIQKIINESNNIKHDIIPGELDKRMKYYENYTETNVHTLGSDPFIIRLRGHNIKMTREISTQFQYIAQKLIHEFHAKTAFISHDEIVLIFNSSTNHQFKGNCMKLQSIIASYASSLLTLSTKVGICSFQCNIVELPILRKNTIIASDESNMIDFSYLFINMQLSSFQEKKIDNNFELVNYIKWRYNKALSIKSTPIFIKKQIDNDDNTKFKYIKFKLNKDSFYHKNDMMYYDLFISPLFEKKDYKNKIKYQN